MTAYFLDEARTHIELTGTDRAKFLHNFCTNDILKLSPGRGCEAFICNVKGRVIGHVTVFVGETSLWLESVPGAAAALTAHLDRYLIRENVTITDRSADVAEILLLGDGSSALLSTILGEATSTDAALHQSQVRTLSGSDINVARIDRLGDPTWLLIVPRSATTALVQRMETAGAVQLNDAQVESLRIAAGFPHYGRDMTDEHLAQEVGRTARCISFTKGCYLGQEPIARLDALGHTNRELRRLSSTAVIPLIAGMMVRDEANTQDIGVITSAASDPDGHGSVALGYLKSRWLAAGTKVSVVTENGPLTALVH